MKYVFLVILASSFLIYATFLISTRVCFTGGYVIGEEEYMASLFEAKFPHIDSSDVGFSVDLNGAKTISDGVRRITFFGLEWARASAPRFPGEYERVLPYSLIEIESRPEWAVFDKCGEYLTSFE